MLQAIFDALLGLIARAAVYILLLPITALLATPIIVVGAVLTRRPYFESVKDGYSNVYDFWQSTLCWI